MEHGRTDLQHRAVGFAPSGCGNVGHAGLQGNRRVRKVIDGSDRLVGIRGDGESPAVWFHFWLSAFRSSGPILALALVKKKGALHLRRPLVVGGCWSSEGRGSYQPRKLPSRGANIEPFCP